VDELKSLPPVTVAGVSFESAAGKESDRALGGFAGGGGELKVSPSKTPSIAVAEAAQAWPPTKVLAPRSLSPSSAPAPAAPAAAAAAVQGLTLVHCSA